MFEERNLNQEVTLEKLNNSPITTKTSQRKRMIPRQIPFQQREPQNQSPNSQPPQEIEAENPRKKRITLWTEETDRLLKRKFDITEIPKSIEYEGSIARSKIAHPCSTVEATESVIRKEQKQIIDYKYPIQHIINFLNILEKALKDFDTLEIGVINKRAGILTYLSVLFLASLIVVLLYASYMTCVYVFESIGFDPPLIYLLPVMILGISILPKILLMFVHSKNLETWFIFGLGFLALNMASVWIYYVSGSMGFDMSVNLLDEESHQQDLPKYFYSLQLVLEIVVASVLTLAIGRLIASREWTWFQKSALRKSDCDALAAKAELHHLINELNKYQEQRQSYLEASCNATVAEYHMLKLGLSNSINKT